jgi:hypothetical protein
MSENDSKISKLSPFKKSEKPEVVKESFDKGPDLSDIQQASSKDEIDLEKDGQDKIQAKDDTKLDIEEAEKEQEEKIEEPKQEAQLERELEKMELNQVEEKSQVKEQSKQQEQQVVREKEELQKQYVNTGRTIEENQESMNAQKDMQDAIKQPERGALKAPSSGVKAPTGQTKNSLSEELSTKNIDFSGDFSKFKSQTTIQMIGGSLDASRFTPEVGAGQQRGQSQQASI